MSLVLSFIRLHYLFFPLPSFSYFASIPLTLPFFTVLFNLFSLPFYLCFTVNSLSYNFSRVADLSHTLAVLSSNFLFRFFSSTDSFESFFSSFRGSSALPIDSVVPWHRRQPADCSYLDHCYVAIRACCFMCGPLIRTEEPLTLSSPPFP